MCNHELSCLSNTSNSWTLPSSGKSTFLHPLLDRRVLGLPPSSSHVPGDLETCSFAVESCSYRLQVRSLDLIQNYDYFLMKCRSDDCLKVCLHQRKLSTYVFCSNWR